LPTLLEGGFKGGRFGPRVFGVTEEDGFFVTFATGNNSVIGFGNFNGVIESFLAIGNFEIFKFFAGDNS
jgi:hypothetical protein